MEAVMGRDRLSSYWKQTLSTTQAAKILSVTPVTILRYIGTGELPARRIGPRGHWRIPRQAVIDHTRCAECIDCGRCRQ